MPPVGSAPKPPVPVGDTPSQANKSGPDGAPPKSSSTGARPGAAWPTPGDQFPASWGGEGFGKGKGYAGYPPYPPPYWNAKGAKGGAKGKGKGNGWWWPMQNPPYQEVNAYAYGDSQ